MHPVVTLFDVDNTLLDNDRVVADLMRYMTQQLGEERQRHYWDLFEGLRRELGYADYLGALQRYRAAYPRDTHVLSVSSFLIDYPFANRLFPESLDAIDRARSWGPVAVLSDGDVVFQPRKINRSGLLDSVRGNVLVYVHKEKELDDVERRYPAERYIFVDDKLWLLDAFKRHWKSRVTTVWPKQGHYITDKRVSELPAPDVTIQRIGELLTWDLPNLLQASQH